MSFQKYMATINISLTSELMTNKKLKNYISNFYVIKSEDKSQEDSYLEVN